MKRKLFIGASVLGIALVLLGCVVLVSGRFVQPKPVETAEVSPGEVGSEPERVEEPEPAQPKPEDYDTRTLTSYQLIVNKEFILPQDYVPADLTLPKVTLEKRNPESQLRTRPEVAAALKSMFKAASDAGIDTFQLSSGYRPYSTQKLFYENAGGASQTGIAPPGASEHQSGLAVDVRGANGACRIELCFKDEPEGKWLAQNAHKFGFVIRYPSGKEKITGYMYEPWHIRYLGEELATYLYKNNLTVEEFFSL